MATVIAMKNPMCAVDLEKDTAAERADLKGKTYHVCSSTCKEKCGHNPEKYLVNSVGGPKNGCGSCS